MAPAAAAKTTSLIETAAPSAALAAFLIRLSRLRSARARRRFSAACPAGTRRRSSARRRAPRSRAARVAADGEREVLAEAGERVAAPPPADCSAAVAAGSWRAPAAARAAARDPVEHFDEGDAAGAAVVDAHEEHLPPRPGFAPPTAPTAARRRPCASAARTASAWRRRAGPPRPPPAPRGRGGRVRVEAPTSRSAAATTARRRSRTPVRVVERGVVRQVKVEHRRDDRRHAVRDGRRIGTFSEEIIVARELARRALGRAAAAHLFGRVGSARGVGGCDAARRRRV